MVQSRETVTVTSDTDGSGLYQALMHDVYDSIFSFPVSENGAPGRISDINESLVQKTGYTREEVVRLFPSDILYQQSHDTVQSIVQKVIAEDHVIQSLILKGKEGQYIPVEIDFYLMRNKSVRKVVAIAHELKDIEKTRTMISEIIHRNEMILNSAGEGIVGIDVSGRVTFMNAAGESMLGWSDEEIREQLINDILRPSTVNGRGLSADECPICAAYQRGESQRIDDGLFLRKDGSRIPVEYTSTPIVEHGELHGAVVVFRDISEEKRSTVERTNLESQLRQAQKMEAIGQLAGGIAHDFNNILVAINGYTDLALAKLTEDGAIRNYLQIVRESGERAVGLVQQLMTFSRKQVVNPRFLDVNTALSNLSRMLPRLIWEDVDLQIVPCREACIVYADPSQIEQIIINLVINARDAIRSDPEKDKEKKITVSVKKEFDQQTIRKLGLTSNGRGYAVLSVSDTGIGMDQETCGKIFEPFFTTKKEGQGTGLGLYTVYGIIKQNNGMIECSSRRGEGTIFKVYWPLTDVARSVEQSTHKTARYEKAGQGRILLVEDDENVRDVAKEALVSHGYTVYEASNGVGALALFRDMQQDIDLLVTDVVMPEMGGKQLYQVVKSHKPGARVLFLSGYTEKNVIGDIVSGDKVDILFKPYSIGELADKVREMLEK